MITNFHIISDIHVAKVGDPFEHTPPPNTPYLIVAGDVCNSFDLPVVNYVMSILCPKYKKVFYVLGNHEYYSKTHSMDEIQKRFKYLESMYDNIVVLGGVGGMRGKVCSDTYTYTYTLESEKLVIFGTTLWTQIPPQYFNVDMNFNLIKNSKQINVFEWNDMFNHEMNLLDRCLQYAKNKGYKVLVVTHHAPLNANVCIRPKLIGEPSNSVYCTDLTNFIKKYDGILVGWVFGHTARNVDIKIGNVRVLSNQLEKVRDEPKYNKLLVASF